jgi:transcriptional regulator with XRE-family HTH domain
VTPEQCRVARLRLGLTQRELARRSGITQPSLGLYERSGHLTAERIERIRAALQASGATVGEDRVLVRVATEQTITGSQCREARRLLGWTQEQLTLASKVAISQVSSFEARRSSRSHRDENRARRLGAALESAGVVFTNGDEPGVKLRKAEP